MIANRHRRAYAQDALRLANLVTMILLLGGFRLAAQQTTQQRFPLAPGSTLNIVLPAGHLHIKRSTEPGTAVLRYSARSLPQNELRLPAPHLLMVADCATITFSSPAGATVEAEVEVPSPVTLNVKINGGGVSVADVKGSKNISLTGGDVDLAWQGDYGSINLVTRAGSLVLQKGVALKTPTDFGLTGQKLTASGPGRYDLTVNLGAGDITIHP